MSLTLLSKLRIKPGMKILTISAPPEFREAILFNDPDVTVADNLKSYDQVHWFVKTQKEVTSGVSKINKLIKEGVICWIYYPKGTSKIQTDLTRDLGWDLLLKQPGLKWLSLVSFNETWSAFSLRRETEADQKQNATKEPREIFNYIDPVKKTIRIPEDLQKALDDDKLISAYFARLAFSHRKEYIEWIVTAKKTETRQKRIQGTIEKLRQNWKNPRNL